MRVLLAGLMLLGSAAFLLQPAMAQDDKEVTLKGKITCAKCDLGVEKACATVIVVKVDNKDVIYYFDKDGHKTHHDGICSAGKAGSVTGVVSEKDNKKFITVKTLKFD